MGDDKKLEWMYKGPTDSINREDYLLGRPVDRSFEQLSEADNQMIGVTVPKNHVEHECIPFSIRAFRGTQGGEQVDMARKIMEDPLMAIKQKEMESRRKILENPVKLKELHRLLKIDQPKSSKKSKKKDKKKRKRRSSDSESDNGNDLDELLAKKYKKIQSVINDESGEANLDLNQLLEDKYDKLSKELDKMGSKRRHSKSSKSERRSQTPEKSRRREEKRRRSPSPARSRRMMSDDEDSSRIVTKNYGLVSADGRSLKIDSKSRREDRPRPSATVTDSRKAKSWTRPERQRLTEEEKEAKRREMMENAVWRDREREKNVRRYREDDRAARARDDSREFDRNFINKELHKAVSRETVESRIKSNLNNIQRSSHSMNANFARR